MDYFKEHISKMEGYTPGEQPSNPLLIKLNTNENPFPPSPQAGSTLKDIDSEKLRLYPDPSSLELREEIAKIFRLKKDNIIIGNGSDDLLTMIMRSFVGENDFIGCFEPSYSLYPVLANIQNAKTIKLSLNQDDFSIPEALLDKNSQLFKEVEAAKIFFITRPNSPTGNAYNIDSVRRFCKIFPGIIVIDEAYVDFAEDNCIEFLRDFPNVIILRTLSKSYSLAGIRVGWGMADKNIIKGLLKVKDSYNVNYISQRLALEALKNQSHTNKNIEKIKNIRQFLLNELKELNFYVIPSESNFIFAAPPDKNGERLFKFLKNNNILVRFFPGENTGKYIRITIGTKEQINELLKLCKVYIEQND